MDNFVNSLLTLNKTLTTVRAAGEVRVAELALPVGDDRIIAHLQFARALASRSIDPRCRGAYREDLIAWGLVGLVQARGKKHRLTSTADSLSTHARAQARETLAEQLPPSDDREHESSYQDDVPCGSQCPLERRLGPVADRV